MKTIKDLMEKICTFKNAMAAFKKARKCKRYRPDVMRFEKDREANLIRAVEDLENGTYTPGPYTVFKVFEPKERVIMALPFYDRVIQHMIATFIEPIFEKRFIFHSFACRKDKGVHEASAILTKWLYKLEILEGKKIWAIKADIRHYFQSVNHEILKAEIRRYISDRRLLAILDRIIDRNGIYEPGVGIPVGNLTSQLFANVYLNILDQFVKHELGIKYYIRYMDDFVILGEDPEELKRILARIEEFINTRLKLQLNPKTMIIYTKNGVDFVGYRHWATMKLLRKAATRRLKQLLKNFEEGTITEEYFDRSLASRLGHMEHADTYQLRQKLAGKVQGIKAKKSISELNG